jgi:hypothetical protein
MSRGITFDTWYFNKFQMVVTVYNSELLGFWTSSIDRCSKNTREHNVSETGLALSNGPNRVGVSPHPMRETNGVSKTDDGQSPKPHKFRMIFQVYTAFWVIIPRSFVKICSLHLQGLRSEVTYSWSWALVQKPPILQLLKNFPAFMEPEVSLPRSQDSYTEPDRSSPHHPILFKIHFNIVPPPTSWSLYWSLSFWLSRQYLICIPLAAVWMTEGSEFESR